MSRLALFILMRRSLISFLLPVDIWKSLSVCDINSYYLTGKEG